MKSGSMNLLISCYTRLYQVNKRFYSEIQSTKNLLVDYFGITSSAAERLIKTYKFNTANVKHGNLIDVLKFFRNEGFSKYELLSYPAVLKIHPITLEQRYLLLKESGFIKIKPAMLIRTRRICNFSIAKLKSKSFVPHDLCIPENYLKYLNPLPDNFDVSDLKDDDLILMEVNKTIVERYLAWRLEATEEEIQRLFRIYQVMKNKSLQFLCENIKIAEELLIPPNKLLKYGYLLHNYPKYPRTVLKEFPNIAGSDLRKAMRNYPKLIMISPKNYVKIYGILKEHNIPDETIRNSMNIFHLSPETVQLRLQETERIPELRTLLCDPKVLKLIVNHNRARSRLSFLQELQLKCAGVTVLGAIPNDFDSHIQQGKDMLMPRDLKAFLTSIFKCKTFNYKRWRQHPFHKNIPFLQMEETYYYLVGMNFRNENILKVMHIILYPREHIEEALGKIKSNQNVMYENIDQAKKLNLILYYIEKEHHFTGNGVWRKQITAKDQPIA